MTADQHLPTDGRWHAVKLFPRPFMWLRRRWGAVRWVPDTDGDIVLGELFGQWYSRERAEEEVRLLNSTEDWINSVHGRFDGFDPKTGEVFELKTQPAFQSHGNAQAQYYEAMFPRWVIDQGTGKAWQLDPDVPDGLTIRALDRSHLGCG